MTTRERNMAVVLVVLLVLGGGVLLGKLFVLDPLTTVNGQLVDRDRKIELRKNEIAGEKNAAERMTRLSPRLGQADKLSLPSPPRDATKEVVKNHETRLNLEYVKELRRLFEKDKFAVDGINPAEPKPFTSLTTTTGPKKELGKLFSYKVTGKTDFASLMKLLEDFYREPLLHKIKKLEAAPDTGSSLKVEMTIEVLQLNAAEKRDTLKPKLGDDEKPIVLAVAGRNYSSAKNLFAPKPVKPDDKGDPPPDKEPKTEAPEDVYPHVKIDLISYSEYYGIWTALIRNQGNKGDTALLAADPLPEDCRYLTEIKGLKKKISDMKEAEKALEKKGLPLEKELELKEKVQVGKAAESALPALEKQRPVTVWEVRDHHKGVLLDLKVVRIDPLQVFFIAHFDDGDSMIALKDNSNLMAAVEKPLDAEVIRKMGLGDRDAALKKVELKELKFDESRKGYEAHLVNGDNKDEKKVLATEMKSTEFDAPDSWTIKDRFGTELVKMKVEKVEKERMIFSANKKYFAVKKGGTLSESMAKPLSDAEVKELKLP